jgi:hypothetical protein
VISVPQVLWDDLPRVRESDPITSHEAADSNNVPRSHQLVANLLEHWGAVAQFEAENLLRGVLSPSRVRSAFSELETLGKVKRTDEFRVTPSGRRAQVWALA